MARFTTPGDFLEAIAEPEHRAKLEALLDWVTRGWPELQLEVKWNPPMFVHHGTYIIGFSVFAKHIAVAPEAELIDRMRGDIEAAGYSTTQNLFRIRWSDPIDEALLARIIDTQIAEKADADGFWRP